MTDAIKLASSLTTIREWWFNFCVRSVESIEADLPHRGVHVENRSLAGNADLALRAFQFIDAASFIPSRHYLQKAHEDSYLNSLRAAVWGADETALAGFFARYFEAEESVSKDISAIHRLSADLAAYITGAEPLMSEAILLATGVPLFSHLTYHTIAVAFGDKAKADEIWRSIEKEEMGKP